MSSLPQAVPAPPAFAGFDTSAYPGDQTMNNWWQSSPYDFAGYYLKAPCHHNAGWMGRRATLADMGWSMLPVYLGQQVVGTPHCTSNVLTAAQGETDALDAASKMASEGFPSGSFVYLDVERVEIYPAALADYITAWISKLASGDYSPGVYCHKHNATAVRAAVLAGLPEPPLVEPRFWIVGGVTAQFHIETSTPTDVGIAFADLWQCPASVNRTFGGVTINLDEDVSQWADPASPEAA